MRDDIKQRIQMIRKGLVPLGYKKTKIGIIPKDWEVKRLGDIAPLQRGFDLPKYAIEPGKYPVCYSNGVLGYHCAYKVKGPGVFTGRSGTIGNAFYVEKNFWPHNTSLWVTDFKGNHPKYIYYMYDFLNLQRLNAGTSVPTLNRNDVHAYRTAIPSEFEQRQITNIIHKWDTVIELKDQVIGKENEQKKGLMQNLLTGEIRLPGFDGEWRVVKLREIANIYRGASPRPISNPKWFDDKSSIGWVRISDVSKSKRVLQQTEQYLSEDGVRRSRFVEKGSIIMSICATIGKPIYTGIDVCIHDGFVVFDKLNINKDFFYYVLLHQEDLWSKYGQTGSQMNLNTTIVGQEKIFIPINKAQQKAIAEILSTADKEIELLEQELELLRLQKKGLMQLLLTGIVRVKEVAS